VHAVCGKEFEASRWSFTAHRRPQALFADAVQLSAGRDKFSDQPSDLLFVISDGRELEAFSRLLEQGVWQAKDLYYPCI
jgi:hypothetical protein